MVLPSQPASLVAMLLLMGGDMEGLCCPLHRPTNYN
jgi:hypothetical protein